MTYGRHPYYETHQDLQRHDRADEIRAWMQQAELERVARDKRLACGRVLPCIRDDEQVH